MLAPLRKVVFILLIAVVALWARFWIPHAEIDTDPTTAPQMAAAQQLAAPLVDALDRYRDRFGSYPIRMDDLKPQFLPSGFDTFGYIYTAPSDGDRMLKSEDCAARDHPAFGFVPNQDQAKRKAVEGLERACVSGYRQFHLQSPDFQTMGGQNPERWAYYRSEVRQWQIGFCDIQNGRAGNQRTSLNGDCRR